MSSVLSFDRSGNSRLVAIEGSNNIRDEKEKKIDLARALGRLVMEESGWILLNGGSLTDDLSKRPTAIDYFVADGAAERARELGISAQNRILTLYPEVQDHTLHAIGRIEISRGRSKFKRLYEIARADALVTIEGVTGTPEMIELAMAMKKPVLPIPCTGGASLDAWERYEAEIRSTFSIPPKSVESSILTEGLATTQLLATTVIKLIKTQLNPLCFVATPFKEPFNSIYKNILAPALTEAGYAPVRVDDVHGTGSIMEDIVSLIHKSMLLIVDLTELNPNVMYELGMAHMLGKPTILMCQTDKEGHFTSKPPFDIQMLRILGYKPDQLTEFTEEIRTTLGETTRRRLKALN